MTADIVQTISPIDDSVVFEQPLASARDIDAALAQARAAQLEWSKTTIAERAAICHRAISYFLDNKAGIGEEITRQMGRPICYSQNEVNGLQERANYMISIAENALTDIRIDEKPGFTRFIRKTPVGLVLVVAPWNFPLLTTVNSVFPAVMAGNAVLIKPSIQTPLVAKHFTESFRQAGAPDHLVTSLCLNHNDTQDILHNGRVDYCCFTGSVGAGQKIESALAGTFKGLTLELGGKDPAYVCEDADIDKTVQELVDGAFFNSGQSCCGIERIYVAKSRYPSFVDAYVAEVERYRLGSPLDRSINLGPLVKTSAANWVRRQINEAVSLGARTCIDISTFEADNGNTAYLAPQVLTQVNHNMSVMTEESFGPVVGIMPVTDDDNAIQLMNDSDFGLTASLWTGDMQRAEAIGNQLETGTVFTNRCDYLDPALVWTGVKQTGKGASLSRLGYDSFTQAKSFHLKHSLS